MILRDKAWIDEAWRHTNHQNDDMGIGTGVALAEPGIKRCAACKGSGHTMARVTIVEMRERECPVCHHRWVIKGSTP
ncbi:hypothetical protein LCGC14_0344370 [marine sediment metagenome]|uniref:Transcription factor zinc-finger domain-containing protein n=1 Tax=marine sediment metagenome TaxID=412755 RepID=A0A0F9VZX4_9ZZZZ